MQGLKDSIEKSFKKQISKYACSHTLQTCNLPTCRLQDGVVINDYDPEKFAALLDQYREVITHLC